MECSFFFLHAIIPFYPKREERKCKFLSLHTHPTKKASSSSSSLTESFQKEGNQNMHNIPHFTHGPVHCFKVEYNKAALSEAQLIPS